MYGCDRAAHPPRAAAVEKHAMKGRVTPSAIRREKRLTDLEFGIHGFRRSSRSRRCSILAEGKRRALKATIICGMFAILAVPFPAAASLGGDAASVEADAAKIQSSLRTTSSESYTIHEMQTSAGVDVKEYASTAGKVFAVTWKGPTHPDLRQLFGPYFEQFVQAEKAQRAQRHGRGPVVIQQPGLVVQVSGRMRSFSGRAYLPPMLPAGVHLEDIR